VTVAGQLDGRSKDVLPALEVAFRRLQLTPEHLLNPGDAVLLRLQEVKRDRVRVEGVQKLVSLVGELGELLVSTTRRSDASA